MNHFQPKCCEFMFVLPTTRQLINASAPSPSPFLMQIFCASLFPSLLIHHSLYYGSSLLDHQPPGNISISWLLSLYSLRWWLFVLPMWWPLARPPRLFGTLLEVFYFLFLFVLSLSLKWKAKDEYNVNNVKSNWGNVILCFWPKKPHWNFIFEQTQNSHLNFKIFTGKATSGGHRVN